MPPPCLHCDRSLLQSCFCYSFPSQRRRQLAPPVTEDDYNNFRQERAKLGKAYDDAFEEEDRLAYVCSEAQKRRLELGRRFEALSPFASTRLLHAVMNVTELRDAILSPLLPGEVLAFRTGCDLSVDKQHMAADLSPLKLILSGSKRLQSVFKDGYNLTLISGTEKGLLHGLLGLSVSPEVTPRTRNWSAILIATKDWEVFTVLYCFHASIRIWMSLQGGRFSGRPRQQGLETNQFPHLLWSRRPHR